jgi:hypothetical protein
MAFEVVAKESGSVTIEGYQILVPLAVFERFLLEVRDYLGPEIQQQLGTGPPD